MGAFLHPAAKAFEDIVDGYFPLAVSLGHLMVRREAAFALLEMRHTPIMQIPDLALTAPVPLNIRAGRAGMVHRMVLRVEPHETELGLSGWAHWTWLDGACARGPFDPMTRLAEPACVEGFVCASPPDHIERPAGDSRASTLGRIAYAEHPPPLYTFATDECGLGS